MKNLSSFLFLSMFPATSGLEEIALGNPGLRGQVERKLQCGVQGFQGECLTTGQCVGLYATAFDCKKSEGGVCFCGNDEVCGCLGNPNPAPTPPAPTPPAPTPPAPTPPGNCGAQEFQGECSTTGQCMSLYATALDCSNSQGGVCFCGDGEVCGCGSNPNPTPVPPTPVPPTPVPPTPVPPPTEPTGCGVPQFTTGWQNVDQLPYGTNEAQGGMIGQTFVMVGGFANGISAAFTNVYSLDMTNPNADWQEMDDLPISQGVTHGAYVVIGSKFYMCGGYLGGHPGPAIDDCVVYDQSKQPGTGQWSFLPSLPAPRAGGGLIYDAEMNALVFSAGAVRPVAGNPNADDYSDTWMLSLGGGGWQNKPDIPFLGNHISFASAIDAQGSPRHYFGGGQEGENEGSGNNKEFYEWVSASQSWTRRMDMAFTRGHASSSTIGYGCGIITVAGSTNEFGKTGDISYYNIETDSWSSIGDLGNDVNTPVCDVAYLADGAWLTCISPYSISKKRKLSV